MRFLIDECVPAAVSGTLRAAGHDCAHAREAGLGGRPDEEIMAFAGRESRILISADTDFGELLANFDQVADDLEAGSLIVIGDRRIRVRRLPIKPLS